MEIKISQWNDFESARNFELSNRCHQKVSEIVSNYEIDALNVSMYKVFTTDSLESTLFTDSSLGKDNSSSVVSAQDIYPLVDELHDGDLLEAFPTKNKHA